MDCLVFRWLSHRDELPWVSRAPDGFNRTARPAWVVIYAPNTVVHILSGKAIARVVRGHFIVDSALNALMLADVPNVPLPQWTNGPDGLMSEREELTEDSWDLPGELTKEWHEDLDKAAALFKNLMEGDVFIEEAATSDAKSSESMGRWQDMPSHWSSLPELQHSGCNTWT